MTYPFKHIIVNRMELICIFLLIMGLATIIFGSHSQSPEIISIIMAIIVLIPCLIIAVGFILFYHNYRMDKRNLKSADVDSNKKIHSRIDGMKSRLTKTQINLFRGASGGMSRSYSRHTMENSDDDIDDEMEKNIETHNIPSPGYMDQDDDDDEIEMTKPRDQGIEIRVDEELDLMKHRSTEL